MEVSNEESNQLVSGPLGARQEFLTYVLILFDHIALIG